MYFTNPPLLKSMESIMQKAPHLTQRGGGRNRSPYKYTKKDCDCSLCLYHRKKKGCIVSECPVLDIRLKCGAAAFYEAVKSVFREVKYIPLRRRLGKYMKKDSDFMIFHSGRHRQMFETEKWKLRKPDGKKLAVLYLLTSDDQLWRKVKGELKNGRIDFPSVHLGAVPTDSYALWKAVKEIQTGEQQISLCELARKEDISDNTFRLIVQAIAITRFGESVLKGMKVN